jgi:hypothetical protein
VGTQAFLVSKSETCHSQDKELLMSDDDEVVYESETNYIDWLTVMQLASFMQVLDPELESVNQEQESWDNSVSKYAVDEAFVLSDNFVTQSVDIRADEQVSQHDWVSSRTKGPHSLQITLDGKSECGKPLAQCNTFNCKHESWVKSAEWLPQVRDEYLEMWSSLSDRPTENNFIGLPGLRYVEHTDNLFYVLNKVCGNCFIYTPKADDTCQNCDKVLINQ